MTTDLFRQIAAAVSIPRGEDFFRSLVQNVCAVLKTDFACISERIENKTDTVHVLALVEDGAIREQAERERPISRDYQGVLLIASDGHALGELFVKSSFALNNLADTEAILNIFASRAAAEVERLHAELALRETVLLNRAILNASPKLILVMDRSGVIENVHPKHSSVFNLPKDSIVGEQLHAMLSPEAATLILSCQTSDPNMPAVVEYSLPASGQLRFYEARTVTLANDRLLTSIRDTTEKKRAETELKESQRFAQRVGETTPNVLFVYDIVEGRNVYVNARSADVLGYTAQEVLDMGKNFIPMLLHPDDLARLPQLGEEYLRRADGEVFEHVFRMKHKNGEWRWVQRRSTIFSRTPDGRPKQILGAVTDITGFKDAERELQELSARLLNIQDEERRRISRELHDVTGQNLAAIGFNLSALAQSETIDAATKSVLMECHKLCEESQKEIRTLSYLLHPPLLDLLGLVRTLEWYIDGLKKRTGKDIVLDMPKDVGRLPIDLETDLFRVIQEGLTNVIHHSGSNVIVIRLTKKEDSLFLQIEDRGHGLNGQETGLGVGIPSMRERMRQHGGTLQINSDAQGTTLSVVLPVKFRKPRRRSKK